MSFCIFAIVALVGLCIWVARLEKELDDYED